MLLSPNRRSSVSRSDAVELRFDSQNESTARWGELTPTCVGPAGLTFSGLGPSRFASIAWIPLCALLLILAANLRAADAFADVVVVNGKVLTLNSASARASAVAIK